MKRVAKLLAYASVTVFLCATVLYVVLLGMQAYSKRQASRILDGLETLKVGDPQAKYEEAVHGCSIEKDSFGTGCVVLAGAYRFDSLWKGLGKLPEPWPDQIWSLSNKLGLRY